MSEKFTTEKDGQIDFYNQFLPRINPNLTVEDIIANNNDGVLNGNLIEFKLSVKDLNEVLFQCIKLDGPQNPVWENLPQSFLEFFFYTVNTGLPQLLIQSQEPFLEAGL